MKNQGTRLLIVFLFGLIMLLGIHPLQSQCNGSIKFEYQNEVDSFPYYYPGCQTWHGFMEVFGFTLTNLDSLIQLESIEGGLFFELISSDLTDFSGLDSLKHIGTHFQISAGGEAPFGSDTSTADDRKKLQPLNYPIVGFNNLEIVDGDFRMGSSSTFSKIDGFNKLHKVTGDFQLSEMPGDTIIGFNQLDSILGNMEFRYLVEGPVEFDAFHNLCYIGGDLIIHGCEFQDLSWTNMIKFIGGDIIISYNGDMPEVKGFNMLSHLGGDLTIEHNTKLASVDGFNHLDSIGGSFSLLDNDSLKSISGFNQMKKLDQSFTLEGTGVTHLAGFQQLREIQGDLRIVNNDSLLSIEAFEQLHQVDTLVISNNELLENLPAFKIQNLNGSIEIIDNPNLLSLAGLDSLDKIGYDLEIRGNTKLQHLGGLQNLDSIGHDFHVIGNDSLISLQDLSSLRYIGQQFNVRGNESLVSLNTALTYIDSITSIWHNDALTSLHFLKSPVLQSDLRIEYNPSLTNLSGLDSLVQANGYMSISHNSGLQSLEGLDKLKVIGGNLSIADNSNLENLEHLSSLDSISGSLILLINDKVSDLLGLQHLRTVGNYLSIGEMESLTSLEGLDHLHSADLKGLSIIQNIALSDCARQSICEYLNAGGGSNFNLNATGCNTAQEVIDICLSATGETDRDNEYLLFPNPANDQVEISGNNISNSIIRLMDSFGHPVNASYQDGILRIGHLSPGLYFVHLQNNKISRGLSFIKI